MNVEYRILTEFPGYRVGSDGSIWTRIIRGPGKKGQSKQHGDWKRLSPGVKPDGYYRLGCYEGGKKHYRGVHKLVLTAFAGPPPKKNFVCLHRNGIRTDNRAENLYWGSHIQNCMDRKIHGNDSAGERNGNAKLTWNDVRLIRALAEQGECRAVLARQYGIGEKYIFKIINGSVWKPNPTTAVA